MKRRWVCVCVALGAAMASGCRVHATNSAVEPGSSEVVESTASPRSWTHAVVVDAGSSGSRVTLFRLDPAMGDLPGVWPVVVPGAMLEGVPPLGDPVAQLPLLAAIERVLADSHVPHERAAVFVWATGGMRALPRVRADAIVADTLSRLGESGFAAVSVEIRSGEREASDALRAVQALRSRDPALQNLDLGIVEIGGASAQLAHGDLAISLAAHGLEAMMSALQRDTGFAACFNPDAPVPGGAVGTGDPAACVELLEGHVTRAAQVPAGAAWVGFSNLDYTADALDLPDATTVGAFEVVGESYCEVPWAALQAEHPDQEPRFLARYCFAALYAHVLLTRGFGLPPHASLFPRREVGGQPVSWTFGALLGALESAQ